MSEAELPDGIAAAAQYAGWKVMHVRPARKQSGGWRTAVQYDGKGWPDLFLAHPDRGVMAIECKSRRGRLTLEQSDWLDTLAAASVDVAVARPGNYNETIATITSVMRTLGRHFRLWLVQVTRVLRGRRHLSTFRRTLGVGFEREGCHDGRP